ncbi:MFS transporter [Vibrio atlanticus]|uniref:MFS transporter n=1 Tax=Vibrio atlanticus TaxID=693153 RepID=UPI00354C5C4D
MLQRISKLFSLYKGLPKDIYYLALARFILGLGNFIIPFMVLLLTQKQGYSTSVAGTLVMVVTGTYMAGSLLGGKLSDAYGHKNIMVIGELLGALVLIACGFFAEHHLIAPGLLSLGYFFIGIAVPASNALVADHSNPGNRDAVMSLSYLAYNLGSGVGPVIAGYLFWNYTEWVYWGNGLAIFIGILVVAFYVKAKPNHIEDEQEVSELEKSTDGGVWSVLKERPRLLVFGVLCTLLWFTLNQMTLTSPLYYSHTFDKEGAILFGQLMTFASISVVLITPVLMRLTSKHCELNSLAMSGVLFVAGYGLVVSYANIPMQFVAWFFLAAAEVLLLTKEGIYIANQSPASHRGRISGTLLTIRNIGLMPTYMFMGSFIEDFGYQSAWIFIIGASTLAALSFWLLYLQQKRASHLNKIEAV